MSAERVAAVLGGTGFIGRLLTPALRESGWRVRVGSRRAGGPAREGVEYARCDLETGEGLEAALAGAGVAYYLVHGMSAGPGFAARDRAATETFARAARQARVPRVVYLGGLYPPGELSEHLASRRRVGLDLIESTGALAVRAGMVVGAGSASFEILRALSRRLPVMIAPRWLESRCQPVFAGDAVSALVGAAGIEGGREVDLAGPDVLTYREMLEITAVELNGRKPVMVPVPFLSPELSAHWLRLVTSAEMNVARSLVASLRHDLVAERPLLCDELGLRPIGFRESVRAAIAEERIY